MLVGPTEQLIRTAFVNEAELEAVVVEFADLLFGASTIYLPQTRIATIGGRGTVPDAVVIDIENGAWYVVEAELAAHGTWEHIAPQVSRQLAAVAAPSTLETLLQLALAVAAQSDRTKEAFRELGIGELQVHGRIQTILRQPPTIAIPIDAVPSDLKEWAQTLRNPVKIWVIEKYVSVTENTRVLFSIPEDNLPSFSTVAPSAGGVSAVRATGSQPFQELIDAMPSLIGQPVHLVYTPRGGTRQHFDGTLRAGGVEFEGQVLSLSTAAIRCLQRSNSDRRSANGWNYWRLSSGERLGDVYTRVLEQPSSMDT